MQWQDFFYICPGHLKERGFCTPLIDEAEAEAKRKKEAMDREIELIKQEYEDKMKKKSKNKDKKAKEEEKGKEKAKDEDGEDDDEEKAKKEKDDKVVYPCLYSVISTAEFSRRLRLLRIKRHHRLLMTYHEFTHFRSTLALCFNATTDLSLKTFDLT